MHKNRASFLGSGNWARAFGLLAAVVMILSVLTGVAAAAELSEQENRSGSVAEDLIGDALASGDAGHFKASSLSEYYAGYIYLQSHANGGTYSCTQGDNLYVSDYATDYNYWDFYQSVTLVWDNATSSVVDSYWSPTYVNYSQSSYANIGTGGLQVSSGRYQVLAVLWDDVYGEIEDVEFFNLTVSAPVPDTTAAVIGVISPNPANEGTSITFSGYGADTKGHGIASYQWRSSIDGPISSSSSFSTSDLSLGTHTIYFKVQCANGVWSPEVSRKLRILGANDELPTYSPVYRFYNRINGSHFYTVSEVEKANVINTLSATYQLDGPAYEVSSAFTTPLYRFYNKVNGSHFYTASEEEKNRVINTLWATYQLDGPAYQVSDGPGAGMIPVYRFYNKINGSHFYTASEEEKNAVINTLWATYQLDGPAFYVEQ